MPFPIPRPSQAEKEQRLKGLPSGPLPEPQTYTLVGSYDVKTQDMHAICRDKGVSCKFTRYTESSYERHCKCKNKGCTYRMRFIQNAERGALYEKGQHNHGERRKRVNDPATIAVNVPAPSKAHRQPITRGIGRRQNLELPDVDNAPTVEYLHVFDEAAMNDSPSNVENAAGNVSPPTKARRQPITRGIGQRQKQKSVKKWKIRTLFKNFEALVNHLMANGVTPYRQPYFDGDRIKRYFRCRHCNYVALSLRGGNPFKKCVLFETEKHRHNAVPVDPENHHFYLEVPDPLPYRLPPGTAIVIDSDDKYVVDETADDVMDHAPGATDDMDSLVGGSSGLNEDAPLTSTMQTADPCAIQTTELHKLINDLRGWHFVAYFEMDDYDHQNQIDAFDVKKINSDDTNPTGIIKRFYKCKQDQKFDCDYEMLSFTTLSSIVFYGKGSHDRREEAKHPVFAKLGSKRTSDTPTDDSVMPSEKKKAKKVSWEDQLPSDEAESTSDVFTLDRPRVTQLYDIAFDHALGFLDNCETGSFSFRKKQRSITFKMTENGFDVLYRADGWERETELSKMDWDKFLVFVRQECRNHMCC